MIAWLGNLRFLRAAILLGLLASSGQKSLAESDPQPLLSFHRASDQRAAETTLPPATAPPQNQRLLPPPSQSLATKAMPGPRKRTPDFALPKIESLGTAGAGLAIVVGLFFVCMWLLRRAGPKPTSPLPQDAVAVLGRVPLAARNFAQLLQVGNKLVLVSVTPDGVAPITEVTDPAEVDRLLGICLRNHKQSTTAEFHHVLKELAQEPTRGFLGNEATTAYAQQSR